MTDTPTATSVLPVFDNVMIIMYENHQESAFIPSATYMDSLVSKGALLTQHFCVGHPSLPNYMELTAGTNCGITSDCDSCTVANPNLIDLLEAKGISWRGYGESASLTKPPYDWLVPFRSAAAGHWDNHHFPFPHYKNILGNPARMKNLVDFNYANLSDPKFAKFASPLPRFCFVVPNVMNDAHDGSIAQADTWTKTFVTEVLALPEMAPGKHSFVWLISDEASGPVLSLLTGPGVKPSVKYTTKCTHFDVLRTLENSWGLIPMAAGDKSATGITGIWQ
jgi:acid phosphatase